VPITRSLHRALAATALAAAVTVLAGCGAGGSGAPTGGTGSAPAGGAQPSGTAVPAVAKDDALAAQVPQDVAGDGKIVFGTDASYAPNEFTDTDGTTIIGMDVDMGTAVAQKLGLQAEWTNSSFDGILPGIEAGRYEMGMSSFSITDERVGTVDMVSYFSAGTSMATLAGNPENLTTENLCGKNVAVQRGTTQVDDIAVRNQACADDGQPAINVTELQLQTDVTLALTSRRVSAMLADSPVAAYAVTTTGGQLEVVGEPYDTAPYGIALRKGQDQLREAVRGAVQALIDDGTYQAILDKWGVGNGAITTSEARS
jgi:polar amino acid transport system substrate-binding protein